MRSPAIPKFLQTTDVFPAFVLEHKAFDSLIAQEKIPFVAIAVLKNTTALEIVLAPRCLQRHEWCLDKRIRLLQLAESQMECLFVAMEVVVIKIGIFIKPKR